MKSWARLSEQRAVPAGGTLHPPLAVIPLRCLSFSGSLNVTGAGVMSVCPSGVHRNLEASASSTAPAHPFRITVCCLGMPSPVAPDPFLPSLCRSPASSFLQSASGASSPSAPTSPSLLRTPPMPPTCSSGRAPPSSSSASSAASPLAVAAHGC